MSGTDPRLDRVIAALNTLEAAQRNQSEVIERLHAELTAAQRDASAAREAAAFAKAETAAYQAELTSTARREDLDRLTDRLDAADVALAAVHRNDAQAASVRDQVVKVSRALSKAASVADLTELVKRIEQIDDRLQVRMGRVEGDVAVAAEGTNEVHSVVAQLAEDTREFRDELERRAMALEAGHRELAERFDRVVVTAEAEIERVAGHLEKRLIELGDRVSVQEAALDQVGDPGSAIGSVGSDIDELHRSLRALRSTVESDRELTRDLDRRVSGADGLGPRLMQLAKIVVGANERDVMASVEPTTDPMILQLHGRLEDMMTRVERLSTLRSRVELLERHLDR
ncbi:MAG TPA: hypothetical protein VMW08_08235 [Acidimicrobiales bacterium]|nr:hypothetical protein [Acidimicrobiales bacterium]